MLRWTTAHEHTNKVAKQEYKMSAVPLTVSVDVQPRLSGAGDVVFAMLCDQAVAWPKQQDRAGRVYVETHGQHERVLVEG